MRRVLLMLLIAVSLSAAAGEGKRVENVATRADATQTYTLFLPSSYDAAKTQPLLLIFDPRGRGTLAAEIFRPAAEQFGWVLISSNDTRSDVAGEDPNTRAVNALLGDVDRYAIDPNRIYVTGFSGTVVVAWSVGMQRTIAGILAVGSHTSDVLPPSEFPFAHYGFAGDLDFNNRDMREIDAELDRAGKVPHRFEAFAGPHSWMSSGMAIDALGWFDVLAMKAETRARDDDVIAHVYERDAGAAARLESERRDLEALRRWRAIARTYEGLRPLDDVRASIARLERDPGVKRARAAEATWDRWEERTKTRIYASIGPALAGLRQSAAPPSAVQLSRALEIRDLKRHAARDGAEGLAARRLLESVSSTLAFYLTRDLFARHEYALAAAALGAALEIHDDRAAVWYNLGAAQARIGDRKHALESLGRAIELGFEDGAHLGSDDDYTSLRDDERFRALLARISSATGVGK